MRVVPLAAEHVDRWRALFEAAGCPCYCHYWHFGGTKHEWLARAAEGGGANARDQAAQIARGDAGAGGLVAIADGGGIVGWMKVAPRALLPKLRALPVYRGLDLGDDEGVFSVGCVLVHPDERQRGVARRLLSAAEGYAIERGGRILEGYPRRSVEPIHAEEAWMGPERVFLETGFVAFAGEAPYPVYRKRLRLSPA